MLKACMTRADITPPLGLTLEGYPHYPRHNTGAHDPLYAACMYLDNGENEVAMVTLDLLFFSKQHVKAVRKAVEEKCGIKGSNIMISCSHTHSGPMASSSIDLDTILNQVQQPKEYVEFLKNKIIEIICEAKANAFPALFARGTEICGAESGIGGNRRAPGGPHDPLVSVWAIKDTNDVIRGAMVNYTLHPTFIHEWSTVCTADYPCYLKLEIEEKYTDCLVGFAQGTSGNQSSRYYRQGESYDEAERVGRTLGKAANKVLESALWTDELDIRVASEEIPVELREFKTVEELKAEAERDKAIYEELYAKYGKSENREEYYLWQNANLKYLGSENQLGYALAREKGLKIEILEDETPAEIQIFALGDLAIIGLQGEIFVEFGIYLKAMAGFYMTVINELSNGDLPGYLCTPESAVTGGYEVGASMLDINFGKHFINKVLDVIERVK